MQIRVLESAAELDASSAIFHTAMVGLPAGSGDESARLEPGRTLGAFLGDANDDDGNDDDGNDGGGNDGGGNDGGGEEGGGEFVGTADATSSWMVLPGGARVPQAAVTHVGVLPTHTRRGVLTALMRRQLEDARERGEVLASLRASEAGIYGRFGYGMASSLQTVELDLRRAVLHDAVPAGGPVRLLAPATAWPELVRIDAAHPRTRAGSIDRHALWWANAQAWASGPGPRYVAVCGEPGAETGFVRYHPIDTAGWFGSRDRTVVVNDLHAPTPDAHIALVRFLMSLDLVDTVVFNGLPLDDPLPWLLTDCRAARVRGVEDETWLRLLDVRAALAARAFAGPGEVVIEVRDALLPENAGSYRISADGTSATQAPAQLAVDVSTLAATFLGGSRWSQLARAGLVEVRDADALARADSLFAVAEEPFAGTMF